MQPIGKITVSAEIPDRLSRLSDIAANFWWTWNFEAVELFESIDKQLWISSGASPVVFLKKVSTKKLVHCIADPAFMARYDKVVKSFDDYMNASHTWFSDNHPRIDNTNVAYFSAEFGLSETLPIYSGGLGILSGDHCKSASDLGIPFTAIGLFYRQGYFNQFINREGIQETSFSTLNLEDLAIKPVLSNSGEKLLISVELPGRTVHASIWQVKVGRISLYLLDTDLPLNSEHDRAITARLYGGDGDTRIQQEIVLGMGGIRALEALGIDPTVYHMNEGHSAFLGLELVRRLMHRQGLNFKEACLSVASSCAFTIHTPVPAGIDVFHHDAMDRYFTSYRESIGISRDEFLSLGRDTWNPYGFKMASLAMTLANRRNGVSMLHGHVTRKMFNNLWPGVPVSEVPVGHVTNGIHTLTWLSTPLKKLFDKYLPKGWEERLYDPTVWESVDSIPDEEFWKTHLGMKENMTRFVNDSIRSGHAAGSVSAGAAGTVRPDILTIGFSRRFATYKRAALIFRDIRRIRKILNLENMPVQLIFAGKAHPADKPGQDVIRSINDVARQEGFEGKVILLENYNISLGRRLVQSVDVWLNNPRYPMEASGTSGMKAAINGVPNLSIPDGWWREGYNGENGWAIGSETLYDNEYTQDNADSESLYEILESDLIPLYYDRNEKGIPSRWIKMMKNSIRSLGAEFSTHRMVQEYTEKIYVPTAKRAAYISADGYQHVRKLADWMNEARNGWNHVSVAGIRAQEVNGLLPAASGQQITLEAIADLGSLKPDDVNVELYYGNLDISGKVEDGDYIQMQLADGSKPGVFRYRAEFSLVEGGEYGYNVRILPAHADLADKFELRLVKWAEYSV